MLEILERLELIGKSNETSEPNVIINACHSSMKQFYREMRQDNFITSLQVLQNLTFLSEKGKFCKP
jgi:hypothetical protein